MQKVRRREVFIWFMITRNLNSTYQCLRHWIKERKTMDIG